MNVEDLITRMTLEQKCALLSGATEFTTRSFPALGIPELRFSDGPSGLRKQAGASDHLGLNPSPCAPRTHRDGADAENRPSSGAVFRSCSVSAGLGSAVWVRRAAAPGLGSGVPGFGWRGAGGGGRGERRAVEWGIIERDHDERALDACHPHA